MTNIYQGNMRVFFSTSSKPPGDEPVAPSYSAPSAPSVTSGSTSSASSHPTSSPSRPSTNIGGDAGVDYVSE